MSRARAYGLIVGVTLAILTVTVAVAKGAAAAHEQTAVAPVARAKAARTAGAPEAQPTPAAKAKRAPSSPPLTSNGGSSVAEEDDGGSPQSEADPLVSNGLDSPLCEGTLGGGELPQASRRDCETSGFVAASAPTADYGLDVHINTGILGFTASTAVQDLLVSPVWMALVWAVHALVVMLEWCFTIDLLDSPSVSGAVAAGLRQTQRSFTEPWLALVLAVASMLALYNGLIRRRVAETVGQAMLVLAMMVGGMWVMLDPSGTVGALGGWANQASLGTLAATSRGTPEGAGGVLADSLSMVFSQAVEAPWCYLEFGSVGWCRSPARLNPQLHAAALRIATGELALVRCSLGAASPSPCVARGSAQARALEHSAELLRDAQSNGAIFLALPADGPARNSINEQGSLLRVMCQTGEATSCRGPMAAQAQFRTNSGTAARIGGLLLILAGALGMLLLFGFIAIRLLAAALFSLLYLMLTPAAVLAPALGEGGRAVFRKWASQLLGAVVSKLLFSFLLGVVLAIVAVLADLESLGWWTQWLLMSAFWWGAYARRHQALGFAGSALGRESARESWSQRHGLGSALSSSRRALGGARSIKQRFSKQPPTIEQSRKLAQAGRERARSGAHEQARRSLEREYGDARELAQAAPEVQARLSAERAQLERVRSAHGKALAAGDTRRASELAHRAERVEQQIGGEQAELNTARRVAGDGEHALRATGRVYSRVQGEDRDRFLDEQSALPASARARGSGSGQRRDYAALAALAGYGRMEYEQLGPAGRRAARLQVDRELALRKEMGAAARDVGTIAAQQRLRRGEKRKADRTFDSALEHRMRDARQRLPARRDGRLDLESWRRSGGVGSSSAGARESSVMRDAREVAARRKRQLGRDRP